MSLHLSATSLPHTAHLPIHLHLLLLFFKIPRIHLVRIYFVINITWPHLDPIQSGSSDGDFVLNTDRIWVKCSLDWTTFWNANISIMFWISQSHFCIVTTWYDFFFQISKLTYALASLCSWFAHVPEHLLHFKDRGQERQKGESKSRWKTI